MTFEQILEAVARYPTRLVEVTGGEPLAHPGSVDLVFELLERGYTVLVETSGAFDVSRLDPRAHKIMDLKCPGSGESDRNLWSNLDSLTGRDEIKFVVADVDDLEWAIETVRQRGLAEQVRQGGLRALLVSPVWEQRDAVSHGTPFLETVAERILASDIPFRFQMQLHKAIWGPDRTGV